MNRNLIFGLFLSTLFCGALAASNSLGLNIFSPGDIVSSSKINHNFSLLESETNRLKNDLDSLRNELRSISTERDELLSRVNSLSSHVSWLENDCVQPLKSDVARLDSNVGFIVKDGDTLVLEGVNVWIRDGSEGPCVPGVGNLLVGREASADERVFFSSVYGRDAIVSGSNNIVVGPVGTNDFTGKGGLCVGMFNSLDADSATVLACENRVTGQFSTVTGGSNNCASGDWSSISGGRNASLFRNYSWRVGSQGSN